MNCLDENIMHEGDQSRAQSSQAPRSAVGRRGELMLRENREMRYIILFREFIIILTTEMNHGC